MKEGRAAGASYRLVVPREAMRGPLGTRLGTRAGSSLDFHDYRDYRPGDDLRLLDWNVYARSDREVVKLHREEVFPNLDVIVDISSSMDLPSPAKNRAAWRLAAACAVAAGNAGCSHAVWTLGADLVRLPESSGLPEAWPEPPGRLDPSDPLNPFAGSSASPAFRRNGVRILVSDLLWPADPELVVGRLADGAAALVLVQVLTAAEEDPGALRGARRMVDSETGREIDVFVDAAALASYRAALAAHRERWSRACRAAGASFVPARAEDLCATMRLAALERAGVLEGV